MIGIGVSPAFSAALHAILGEAGAPVFEYEGRPITLEVIHVLVRYRLAQRANRSVTPCSSGDTYCANS